MIFKQYKENVHIFILFQKFSPPARMKYAEEAGKPTHLQNLDDFYEVPWAV